MYLIKTVQLPNIQTDTRYENTQAYKHTDKWRIIYGKLLSEIDMWPLPIRPALWTMDTVLAELFYRECLTGLSNPGSCVSYRRVARDLGSSSGELDERAEGEDCPAAMKNVDGTWNDEKSPLSAAPRIRELALNEWTSATAKVKYPHRFPTETT